MLAKKNHFSNKRSEYRLNYLPFDYYDFWITAKENENLRFKNKLRDYLHTPFDWDENLEIYQESNQLVAAKAAEAAEAAAKAAAHFDRINQATQTSSRPNRHDHLKKLVDEREELERKNIRVRNLIEKGVQTSKKNHRGGGGWRKKAAAAAAAKSAPSQQLQPRRPSSSSSKSASIQVDMDRRKAALSQQQQQQQVAVRSRSAVNKNLRNQSSIRLEDGHVVSNNKNRMQLASNDEIARSMSNMSIQTPIEWNLRDYSRTSIKSAPISGHQPRRSISMANINKPATANQPKRPPFANYGWAVKTKDMSQKPTHNKLANRVLAVMYHDENAINELKLQRLKKDATLLANEILANESKSLDRFRSDSRDWSSEYNERYLDYSKVAAGEAASGKKRQDFYFSLNPTKLRKSSPGAGVVDEKAEAARRRRRNPSSTSSKINFYYYE